MFSVVTIPIYITSHVQGFPFLHTLTFVFSRLFDYSHFDWCDVIPNCGFHLHFTNNGDVEHLFMCLLATCMSFLEKCLFKFFAHFWIELFVWFLRVVWAVYVFWIWTLVSLKFLSFVDSFLSYLKVLSLIRPHLFIFAFIYFALGDWSKKTLLPISVRVFCLCPKSVMVSGLTFRSLNHFEGVFYLVWFGFLYRKWQGQNVWAF